MRLQIRNADVELGANLILQHVDFEIHDREKIAVVGSDPAALSCAYYLALTGYPVTLFAEELPCSAAEQTIMEKLAKMRFVEGDFAWQRPYHVLGSPLVYEITDDFPRITPGQFVGGHFPSGITKLVYHVSLYNRPSCPLDDFITAVCAGTHPVFTA